MMKILVVRYRFIGDMILTIPFLRNLRRAYPFAQIDMLVSPNSGEVIENCPYVNNFIYFDTTRKHKYEIGNNCKKSFFYYVSLLRKEKYDKAYILKRSFSSALLCFLSGVKQRIGYNTENRGFLLTKKVKYDKQKHESLCFLDVLKADNIDVKDYYLETWINEESKIKVDKILIKNGIINEENKIAINASASNENKMWDINNFAKIVEYLSNEKNIRVIFIGAEIDKKIYKNMKYEKELKIKPVNLCGELNIQDSLALLKKVKFIIGNDSGNLHMASSAGTPVIGLYGPMPFEKWKVIGGNNICLKADLDCMPCSLKKKCKNNNECMKKISVDDVKKAVDEMLKNYDIIKYR